jgi:membrane-associated phospholipid phosphatase
VPSALPEPLAVAALVAVALAGVLGLGLLVRSVGRDRPGVPRTVGTGLAVAAVLLVAQGAVARAAPVRPDGADVDHRVLDWMVAHREPVVTGAGVLLARLGGTAAMTLLTVVAVLALVRLGRRPAALVVAVTALGGGLLVVGFKAVYRRPRPPRADQVIHYSEYALPSGHALGSAVVLGIVAAASYPLLRGAAARRWLVAGAAAGTLAVGVSRVYLAAHWLTDVLTGWLLGGAWLSLGVTALALCAAARREDPVSR